MWKKPVRGKRGKPKAGFPLFPPPLESRTTRGIPLFPQPRLLLVSHEPNNLFLITKVGVGPNETIERGQIKLTEPRRPGCRKQTAYLVRLRDRAVQNQQIAQRSERDRCPNSRRCGSRGLWGALRHFRAQNSAALGSGDVWHLPRSETEPANDNETSWRRRPLWRASFPGPHLRCESGTTCITSKIGRAIAVRPAFRTRANCGWYQTQLPICTSSES